MKLLIRTSPSRLSKAKTGLVPVKKQVTKNGKTFMQTFYVKADTPPEGPTIITQGQVEQELPDNPRDIKNMPDGFYIQHTYGNKQRTKVPSKYIHSVFRYLGATFVCHLAMDKESQTIGPKYVVSELTTGLRVGPGEYSPEEAIESLKNRTIQYTEKGMQQLLDSRDKITDVPLSGSDPETYSYTEPTKVLTDEERDDEIRSIFADFFQGDFNEEDGYSKLTGTDYQTVKSWVEENWDMKTGNDVSRVRRDISIYEEDDVRLAVQQNIDLDSAETLRRNIDTIQEALSSNDYNDIAAYEDDILKWAEDAGQDLTSEMFDADDFDVEYPSLADTYMYGAAVIAFAYEGDMGLYVAKRIQEDAAEEAESAMTEDVSILDDYGEAWSYEDLEIVGRWVRGSVNENREDAKALDNERRVAAQVGNVDEPSGSFNPIVATIEAKMSKIQDEFLYRGTGNDEWEKGKIGDVIPIGLASFTHSEEIASRKFQGVTRVLLVIDNSEDNPIVGVDVANLIEAGENQGFMEAIISSGVGEYDDEEEVIVRAPALEIVSKSKNDAGGLVVHAKMAEMNLIPFVKSEITDRIKAMEATFNYPLHREEDAPWNQ
jgi:hypothetical protein